MRNRILTHLVLVILFAIAQISIATHSVEHIEVHAHESHSDSTDKGTADAFCVQCLAQSHAHFANVQGDFTWPVLENRLHLSVDSIAKLFAHFTEYFCARAPPTFFN